MTPARQKWWDSLPAEEKRVRQDIKRLMDDIYFSKETLQLEKLQAPKKKLKKLDLKNLIISCQMQRIREHKRLIKALRKQIGMCPIKREFKVFRYCPTCDCILNVSRTRPYCDKCGQKLRWK